MTDIVARLKDVSFSDPEYPLYREAAERIEYLQSTEANEILRLRQQLSGVVKALQNIADQMLTSEMELESAGDFEGAYDIMIGIAREALRGSHVGIVKDPS